MLAQSICRSVGLTGTDEWEDVLHYRDVEESGLARRFVVQNVRTNKHLPLGLAIRGRPRSRHRNPSRSSSNPHAIRRHETQSRASKLPLSLRCLDPRFPRGRHPRALERLLPNNHPRHVDKFRPIGFLLRVEESDAETYAVVVSVAEFNRFVHSGVLRRGVQFALRSGQDEIAKGSE